MDPVSRLRTDRLRNWTSTAPASDVEIEQLVSSSRFEWPESFLALLRYSNGGEGDLALPPMWFKLFEVAEIIDLINDDFYKQQFPNFLIFGGNGGLEMIGFDLRKKTQPILMLDPIAGPSSSVEIASNIDEFIDAVGLEFNEDA
jgi:hypothetical protein